MEPPSFKILSTGTLRPDKEPSWCDQVPARMKRRDPRIWHMAWVAASRALKGVSSPPRSIITATGLGALEETRSFLDGVFRSGFGSPRNFIASVHNSMAGKLAIEFKISGPNLTFCEGANSLASALRGCEALVEGDFPLLVVAVEENTEFLRELSTHLYPDCAGLTDKSWTEAAVALVLSSEPGSPSISAVGPRSYHGGTPEDCCAGLRQSLRSTTASYVSPSEGTTSFVAPALAVADFLADRSSGSVHIAAFSGSSKCASVVEVCD